MDASNRTARLTAVNAAAAPARPQQPDSSPAASLPTETLRKILRHVLEDLDALEAQAARLAFGKVAALWWLVAEVDKLAVVNDSFQAGKLAVILRERRIKLYELDLSVEAEGEGRAERLAALVNACPKLRILSLYVRTQLGSTWADHFGRPLYHAILSMSKLRDLYITNTIPFSPADLHDLLRALPRLQAFRAPGLHIWPRTAPILSPAPHPSLVLLHLPSPYPGDGGAVERMLGAAASSIKYVELEASKYPSSTYDLAALIPYAPRLLYFHMGHAPYPEATHEYLNPIMDAVRQVEDLSIGLDGHTTSKLFGRLARLDRLRTCTILCSDEVAVQVLEGLAADDAVSSIEEATCLRSLTLPNRLREVWMAGEILRVEEAARKSGVRLKLSPIEVV